ncbi:UNVERIFIED_CONTAM: hypothetical protein GTU68_003156 [Idotea baltica]|nr:hypothetical protein [Idotea baltica]
MDFGRFQAAIKSSARRPLSAQPANSWRRQASRSKSPSSLAYTARFAISTPQESYAVMRWVARNNHPRRPRRSGGLVTRTCPSSPAAMPESSNAASSRWRIPIWRRTWSKGRQRTPKATFKSGSTA